MKEDLGFSCACGAVGGVLRAHKSGETLRCVCYCRDCQAFAFFLGREAVILDAHGGTDIYQTRPAWFAVTKGRERLGCVEVSPGGMKRFYAACCNTPLANSAGPRLPFIGTIAANYDRSRRAALLPPIRTILFAREAHRAPPPGTAIPLPLIVLDFMRRTITAFLGGDWRRHSLHSDDGSPVVPVRTLTPAERAGLDRKAEERYAA